MSVILDWKLLSLLGVFWCQSVIIGYFWFRRLHQLKKFSTQGFEINDRAVDPTPETRRTTANFFALHFGGFHVAYFAFLSGAGAFASTGWLWIALIAASFAYSHWNSYRSNIAADNRGCPNIGTMLFLPYARVIPMHLMIVLGGTLTTDEVSRAALVGFGILKTLADLCMHAVEHKALRARPKLTPT